MVLQSYDTLYSISWKAGLALELVVHGEWGLLESAIKLQYSYCLLTLTTVVENDVLLQHTLKEIDFYMCNLSTVILPISRTMMFFNSQLVCGLSLYTLFLDFPINKNCRLTNWATYRAIILYQ